MIDTRVEIACFIEFILQRKSYSSSSDEMTKISVSVQLLNHNDDPVYDKVVWKFDLKVCLIVTSLTASFLILE